MLHLSTLPQLCLMDAEVDNTQALTSRVPSGQARAMSANSFLGAS
jgi:hypothetical protein